MSGNFRKIDITPERKKSFEQRAQKAKQDIGIFICKECSNTGWKQIEGKGVVRCRDKECMERRKRKQQEDRPPSNLEMMEADVDE